MEFLRKIGNEWAIKRLKGVLTEFSIRNVLNPRPKFLVTHLKTIYHVHRASARAPQPKILSTSMNSYQFGCAKFSLAATALVS